MKFWLILPLKSISKDPVLLMHTISLCKKNAFSCQAPSLAIIDGFIIIIVGKKVGNLFISVVSSTIFVFVDFSTAR